ncbi:MAG: hypothetical protein OEX81_00095 [Candidatus Pacebacteria bacterium]|nr:hypothetical protein [Candidatus Paceibacterota bacterium]
MFTEKKLIAQDVDECIFNSVDKHYLHYKKEAETREGIVVPSLEEVIRLGGTHAFFGQFEWYAQMNKDNRNDEKFNRGQERIDGSLEALTLLESQLAVYLTTRPESLLRVTQEELDKYGYPDRQVICRPKEVNFKKTTEWKTWMLAQLAMQFQAQMLMVDDSINLHQHLNHAKLNGSKGLLDTILYAGPMTPKGNGEMTWEEIVSLMMGKEFAA